ncbi:MAG: ABC transporter substrate-binding protein, partial [Spirochaetales bacterium]
MKKLLLIFALVALLATSLFAAGAAEVSTRDKSKVAFVVSGSPFRFFHLTSNGCGGDDNIVLANVYDNLLCLENDGSLSNSLAENYEISADGTTYTFYLRKGVKFTNGAPLTAEDVVWSIQKGSEGPLGGALFINYK